MIETTLGSREKIPNGHCSNHTNGSRHTERPAATASVDPGLLVRVSKRFLLLSLLACTLVAFAVGRTARMLLFINPHLEYLMAVTMQQRELEDRELQQSNNKNYIMKLPNPVLKNGKQPPPTLYTSKNFDTARSAAINSRWVVTEQGSAHDGDADAEQACQADDDSSSSECSSCRGGGGSSSSSSKGAALVAGDGEEGEEDEEEHLPVGQHLLMDIRNVDASFLASEERLANAMLDVVGECGLTLLSYHCHGLHPAGVSCVGVLLESHVSFHTWPVEGVITMDLFTCGPNSLLPIVSKVEELFSVPRPGATHLMDMPESIWAYKVRGFGEQNAKGEQNEEKKAELTDLFTFPIGAMTDYKKEIATAYIGPDRFDIYDVLRSPYQTLASYKRMLTDESSYEAQHPAVFEPDRIVFTNGVLQSRRSSEAVFYEMFVHPAMFAHKNPENIAVVGFGDGAILRELLKHKTVKRVVLLEYEEALLNFSMTYFPQYHDCSFLGSDYTNCLDDPRVTTYYGDVAQWFAEQDDKTDVSFDVIVFDEAEYIGNFDTSVEVLKDLQGSMADDGVLVTSMGFAPATDSPAKEMDSAKNFLEGLVAAGFASVRDYEEGHLGFEDPWRFVIAFKSLDTNATWFRHDISTNISIQRRIVRAPDGSLPMNVFDGAVQHSIMYSSNVNKRSCFDLEGLDLSFEDFVQAKRQQEAAGNS